MHKQTGREVMTDKEIDRQVDRWKDRQMNGRTVRQTDKQVDRQTDRCTERQRDIQTNPNFKPESLILFKSRVCCEKANRSSLSLFYFESLFLFPPKIAILAFKNRQRGS